MDWIRSWVEGSPYAAALVVQCGESFQLRSAAYFVAEHRIGRWGVEESFVDAPEVEQGSADDDDRAPAAVDFVDGRVGLFDELGDAE